MISTKKPKISHKKDVKLTRYLVARSNGSYEFVNKPKEQDILEFFYATIGCDQVQLCPVTSYFWEYRIWINENGMMEGKSLNQMLNPFCEPSWLFYIGKLGGPHGDAIIEAPGTRSTHWKNCLETGFRHCLRKIMNEIEMKEWLDKLDEAVELYLKSK